MDGRQASIWTAMPAIVQSFDPVEMTCSAQVAIAVNVRQPDGSLVQTPISLLIHCPVQFPQGGGVILTFAVAEGDECLMVFASRCIDSWWQNGGVQPAAEVRFHDLSDGFALMGFRSQPRKVANISTTSAQLRSDDGETFVDLDPNTKIVTITAPGGITLNGNVQVNGYLHATDVVRAGDGGADQVSLQSHTHPDPQGGNTGAPNPGT